MGHESPTPSHKLVSSTLYCRKEHARYVPNRLLFMGGLGYSRVDRTRREGKGLYGQLDWKKLGVTSRHMSEALVLLSQQGRAGIDSGRHTLQTSA